MTDIPEDCYWREDDQFVITTPQFDRVDGIVPNIPNNELFGTLHTKTKNELVALGLGNWDNKLYLLPYEWHKYIPNGFVLTCIDGNNYVQGEDKIDDDYRFGLLAYGIIPDFAK